MSLRLKTYRQNWFLLVCVFLLLSSLPVISLADSMGDANSALAEDDVMTPAMPVAIPPDEPDQSGGKDEPEIATLPDTSAEKLPPSPLVDSIQEPVSAAMAWRNELPESYQEDMRSGQLYYEAAPVSDESPSLYRLIVDEGWRVNAPLYEKIRRLPNVAGIECFEVRYRSHTWRGQPVTIFGYYGVPTRAKRPVPALLFVHGGGGYATLDRVIEWASRGYAVLCIDLPGKGVGREKHSRSTGPDMTVQQIFTVGARQMDSYIFHAVLAQVRGISFLASRKEIDSKRIGLIGLSWGGATGLITTSIDKRIRCLANVYGSGFLRGASTWAAHLERMPEAQLAAWEAHFDPAAYLSYISQPVFGVTGTNDNCYYLPRFVRSLRAIQPTPDMLLRPNLDHKIDDVARIAIYKWMDRQLKSSEEMPKFNGWRTVAGERGIEVAVSLSGRESVKRVTVTYGPVSGNAGWTNRKWKSQVCELNRAGTWWSTGIVLPTPTTIVYATAYFHDGTAISSPVHTLGRVILNGNPVSVDMPFINEGPMQMEARQLARYLGATCRVSDSGEEIILQRGELEKTIVSTVVDSLRFIPLRETCDQFGCKFEYDKGNLASATQTGAVRFFQE